MMVTYEAMNMLFQAFIAFATMATRRNEVQFLPIALIVLLTNKKK